MEQLRRILELARGEGVGVVTCNDHHLLAEARTCRAYGLEDLELMLSENAKRVTDDWPAKRFVLPLYLEGDAFVGPHCCYGNDVNSDLCGAWVVFHLAAKLEEMGRAGA